MGGDAADGARRWIWSHDAGCRQQIAFPHLLPRIGQQDADHQHQPEQGLEGEADLLNWLRAVARPKKLTGWVGAGRRGSETHRRYSLHPLSEDLISEGKRTRRQAAL